MTATSAAPIHSNVVPSEVGWQFVPQYYTYMNKQPNRLHCFYTKNSTFLHGTEGEEVKPCYGQQEIHNKILSIGFSDCKVFIHSVDAQSSANGGIIIQVIGEMSNNGEAWRKFAQTFFLAEQPNGYFVLNDIFRYLKEESVDPEDIESDFIAPPDQHEPTVTDMPSVPESEPMTVGLPIQESNQVDDTSVHVVQELAEVNGFHEETTNPDTDGAATSLSADVDKEHASQQEPEAEPTTQSVPEEATTVSAVPEPSVESAPIASAAPQASVQPVAPPQPPAQQTWANLAAANPNRWGSAVAQEAKGISAMAAPSVSPAPSGASTPARDGQVTPNRSRDSSAYTAAMSVTTAQCFVKGVMETVGHSALSATLSSRFGPIKDLEIVRAKACAFLEFVNVDSARRAIAASLPLAQGGEGGIRIDVGEAGQARITVETRKERADRPPPRPHRGGGPPNGDSRGSFRGRGVGDRGGRGRGVSSAK